MRASSELNDLPLDIDDTPAVTVSAIRTRCRRLARQNKLGGESGLGMVVIDYLQLIAPSHGERAENRVQEISSITRGLKALAKDLKVPVLALSQLSRAVEQREDKRPQLADLRESGSIEQDADIVMFIYREAYYNPETERENITDLIIAKHRNGPTGKVELYFHPERLRFVSLDRKHDA